MNIRRNIKNREEKQTFIVIVDSFEEGLKAARFVLGNLYADKDRFVLLQAYNVDGLGLFLMRNFSKVLKDTAMRELKMLGNKLVEEFHIVPEKIEKMVTEGDLALTLKKEFSNTDNPFVVIGEDEDIDFLKHKTPQKHISAVMKEGSIENILYIEDDITIINESKIKYISENHERIAGKFDNYLAKLSKRYSLEIEYVNLESEDAFLINDGISYSILNDLDNKQGKAISNIPKKSLINTNVECQKAS